MGNLATTGTVTVTDKSISLSADWAYGDKVTLTLSGVSSYTYGSLRLSITTRAGEEVASCLSFSAGFVGTLDLHTDELQAVFADLGASAKRRFRIFLTDISGPALLVNDWVTIENNPTADGEGEPTPLESVIADIQSKLGKVRQSGSDTKWHELTVHADAGGEIEVGAEEEL